MTDSVTKRLFEMPKERLVKTVLAALGEMDEKGQISFISKHIDARISLEQLGEGDPAAFIGEVDRFCLDCLDGAYFSDDDDIETYFTQAGSRDYYGDYYYDDDWDYDEYFSNTEWAHIFLRLFKLSMMYIRSGDVDTGYEAISRLLSCLEEADFYEEHIDSKEYISLDWYEMFPLYYDALFQYHTDPERATERAFQIWKNHGDPCDDGFLANVKDLALAERYILEGIRFEKCWAFQCQCFLLLEKLYGRLGEAFDKASHAKALLGVNEYFHKFVVEGLCEQSRWQDAVEAAHMALEQIPVQTESPQDWSVRIIHPKVRASIQANLVNAYVNLADFPQAFEASKAMFQEAPDFSLYVQTRRFAEKTVGASAFLAMAEAQLGDERLTSSYARGKLLPCIYSYEGIVEKLMALALSQKIGANYYDRKYVALSLIYRAMDGIAERGDGLSEYLNSASSEDGIADMLRLADDAARRTDLLLSGADLLKGIVGFHIDAAKRNRYAKAAYNMCVLRDIYIFLDREDEFKGYFRGIITENARRPALRDEMSIVYGKSATSAKKV